MNRKPVIAVDGYSSTGKSSISKIIAQRLGLIHMDTGALYRGITLFAIQNHITDDGEIDMPGLLENLHSINLEFRENDGVLVLFLNEKNISAEIRTLEISNLVSFVAKQAEIRDYLTLIQKNIATKGGIIMDGRDIGTVVLPDADYKFFMTASVEERTRRRLLELKNQGQEADENSVRKNLLQRDKIDSEREISPLKEAPDAIRIDNTSLSKLETVELMLSYIR